MEELEVIARLIQAKSKFNILKKTNILNIQGITSNNLPRTMIYCPSPENKF